ncbi:DUF5134 domain-containing protein [Nocardia alni]|uniref:DUF5134 domain-containing protein n=1 Tax=Nocardia alni TaxID=2815723 RepID=UPI001C240F0E|nr:DUF5134 domain-containing protein [Nocardia alni]
MGSMTTMLPEWVRLVWALVLVVVALLHIWHARSLLGQPRWWHAAHTAMAVGMVAMYAADPMGQIGLDRVLLAIFGALAVVLAVVTIAVGRREGVVNPLWVITGLDTAAMAYMSAVMLWPGTIVHAGTWIVIGYLCVDALAWIFGVWERIPVLERPPVGLRGHDSLDIRISLAVMAAGMTYMLLAMV